MNRGHKSAVALAHQFIANALPENGVAVDATAGNGNDTVFLAEKMPKGTVYSFDIQPEALAQTKVLLEKQGLSNVKLIHDGHQNIDSHLSGPVDAAMFNLGYLPKGDHSITTKPDNTVVALDKVTKMLKVGGRISLIVYTGHPGGLDELMAVENYLSGLDSLSYWVTGLKFINRPPTAPVSFFVERVI
ncbi:class I SAM-dependent methyltransferase [Peptococcaceae bacterium 1198_IL3148]